MSKANEAAAWSEAIAWDDTNGYDQTNRWGPDWDCSSLPIRAYELAGVPVRLHGAGYTGNMVPAFLACGFRDVKDSVDLATGAGLQRGDVLVNVAHHAAICLGNGKIVNAGGNEFGGVTGGQSGDQTGREIRVMPYYLFPKGWDHVLRYIEEEPGEPPQAREENSYTVRSGDTLSGIAAAYGVDMYALAKENGIVNIDLIFPGQVLRIPGAGQAQDTQPEPGGEKTEQERIAALARAVIAGEYGNGLIRMLRLGKDYKAVQTEVNRLLT